MGDSSMTRMEARRSTHEELMAVVLSLIAEFSGHLPAGTVIRVLGEAREQLLASGARTGLVAAAEAMARAQLCTLLPARGAIA